MKKVAGIGINDMPRGWTKENETNQRIYNLWNMMLQRCYSEKSRKKYPTYENCYICEKWHKLSGFVEDLPKIENFTFWLEHPNERVSLDKDIKEENNKCYCVEKCKFVSCSENTIKSNEKNKGQKYCMKGKPRKEHKNKIPVVAIFEGKILKIFKGIRDASKETGICYQLISNCCSEKRETAGKLENGQIVSKSIGNNNKVYWKYLYDVPEEMLQEFYENQKK